MEKISNFLKNKSFPNYILLILSLIILILIVVIIALASSTSTSYNSIEQEQEQEQQKEEDVSTLTPWEKYKKAEKYLYIWEYFTPDYIINMCKEHHFTRV